MSGQKAPYVTLDVFTSQRFKGNPVAIVKLTDVKLSQEQKQQIAKEFNFSETVFLHPTTDGNGNPQVDIFTPVNEMEFAGHPIIGAGHFLFRQLMADAPNRSNTLTVMTKAGPVPISYDPANEVVSAEVPHNINIHQQGATPSHILPVQASLAASDLQGLKETSPVVSVVKGVTYALVDLTERPDIFANIVPGGSPDLDLDEGWSPSFTGIMYHRHLGSRTEGDLVIWDLRVRMIAIDLEDPACGSGGCSLGAYLALSNGQKGRNHRFYIDQGIEMGRDSRVIVDVLLDEDRKKVSTIKLAGHAAFVAEGSIFVD
ncbi:hypothetical protein N7517_011215 [Penicillium concentricum]|uniref:Phenazine biosynthesis-like protein n=1 Tax=Penicillium concentricum TaxID=293559 RepID=A0A9W9UVT9_9EURO|nr:uncharacterized protein N7517_011215 [Penicillium concentricum]KAJ5356606.1 hypothetical protein N7517_011215 [Penicillium concentricum]